MCFGNRHLWRLGRNVGMEGLIMNQPAFPQHDAVANELHRNYGKDRGMTLRDYFAAKAMHGIISDPDTQMSYQEIAIRAYQYADAMLEMRKK